METFRVGSSESFNVLSGGNGSTCIGREMTEPYSLVSGEHREKPSRFRHCSTSLSTERETRWKERHNISRVLRAIYRYTGGLECTTAWPYARLHRIFAGKATIS